MECAVCIRDWNSSSCIPKMLSCGHSFCESCLSDLYKTRSGGKVNADVPCPNCLVIHKFNHVSELGKLTKNFALIQLAET